MLVGVTLVTKDAWTWND